MRRRDLPSFSALRAFEAAARRLSFRLAARELAVTDSAVSHQIRELERSLGTALFRRLGRRVELTPAGALYYPILREAFERMARGTALVRRAGSTGELVLQVYVTVAVRWLLPRLYRFHERYPDILLRISTSYRGWEFDADYADVGFVYCRSPLDAGQHHTPLFRVPIFPVASPGLVAAGLREPADLAGFHLIRVPPARDEWKAWLEAAGHPELEGLPGPAFDTYLLAFEAALAGRGVAMAAEFMIRSELESGRLVRPFALAVEQPGSWYLVCRNGDRHDPRIARLREWLLREVAADPCLVSPAGGGRSPHR